MQRIVTDRWGLTIKSLFTWDKIIIGMGYWGRSRYEYLIIATKGRGLRCHCQVTGHPTDSSRRQDAGSVDIAASRRRSTNGWRSTTPTCQSTR
jgi:N6-adenosine-specific RNA methylase IME4